MRYADEKSQSLSKAGVRNLRTLFLILALLLGAPEPQHTVGPGFSEASADTYVIPQGPLWLSERAEEEGEHLALLPSVFLNELAVLGSAACYAVLQQTEQLLVGAHPIRGPPGHPLLILTFI